MLKKSILSASFCLMLLAGAPAAAWAQDAADSRAPYEEVQALPDGQEAVMSEAIPSEEVNTVEVSQVAQKMSQAEKAQNVKENDSWGGAITIIAMCIVVGALVLLSLFFLGFGKISEKLLSQKKLEAHGKTIDDVDDDHEHVDSGEVIAAISMALAEHFNDQHDIEDTILTIRRMRRAYSPWNSKIYNLRESPALQRNPHRPMPVSKNK
ncbi:MAG: OadG family protein [Muribaculaceae bacterium]|nr:OadG family protein [Muribaculaceae bacterium]